MAGKVDRARVELATAIVKHRTAQIQLRAREVQLLVVAITLATAVVSGLGALLLLAHP